jgi:hypothetical protein
LSSGRSPQALADLDPAEHRHHHVEADEIGLVLLDRVDRRPAVDGLHDVVTLMLQELLEKGARRRLVVDREN